MTASLLRFVEDPASGLPLLEDPAGTLSPDGRDRLKRELDQEYPRLIRGEGEQFINLPDPEGERPLRWFRVTVTDRDKRCPTLLLEAVEPGRARVLNECQAEIASPRNGRWEGGFLGAVAELLGSIGPETEGARALRFVLGDLRALARKDPEKLASLLLAGYLHVGDALCLHHGGGENRYAEAAEALARLRDSSLPEGALEPLLR